MWPILSNIEGRIADKIRSRNNVAASKLNSWVRVYSGANEGLILKSHPEYSIFTSFLEPSVYGGQTFSGTIGETWGGKNVSGGVGRALRPRPIITSIETKETKDQISRQATLKIKCFSLEQLEKIQEYFMEPGYTLCIEYGWNTDSAKSSLLPSKGSGTILKKTVEAGLNMDTLHNRRIYADGDWDCFLGFIVGGSVSNDGENFDVEISLRGSPALPTYMQSHNKPLEQESVSGKLKLDEKTQGPQTYSPIELTTQAGESGAAQRRFKAMFNDLPSFRQTKEIKSLITNCDLKDFINFDKVISNTIAQYSEATKWYGGKKEITVSDVSVERDKLFSKQRYVRLSLIVDILNKNSTLEKYKVGDKEVTMQIDVHKTPIGAFPCIYSTKKEKLAITGKIPDFTEYFVNTKDVNQNTLLTTSVDASVGSNRDFVQYSPLNDGNYHENKGHWGYLENLYVNFDMFKNKIEQKNKNIREIFLDILNEMSSAVNSYWNFQIIEKKDADGNIILGVIDENWIGKPKAGQKVQMFENNGKNGTFINSTLDISLPGEMTNAIIGRRLKVVTNPDAPITDVGGFFSAKNDLFLNEVVANGANRKVDNSEEAKKQIQGEKEVKKEEEQKQSEKTQEQIDNYNAKKVENLKEIREIEVAKSARKIQDGKLTTEQIEMQTKYSGVSDDELKSKSNELSAENRSIVDENSKLSKAKKKQEDTEKENAKQKAQQNLTQNLGKIDVVPIVNKYALMSVDDAQLTTVETFKQKFVIYCFDDTTFLDKLKNTSFYDNKPSTKEHDGENLPDGRLSQPLPIKYSFKILGISGLRRGDMFNINGIPSKYKKHGVFQITELSHVIENMNWVTSVTGEYRQIQ
jgi:hypothetical protein